MSRCIIWASRCPHNKRKEHFVNENHKSQDSDHEDSSCDEKCEDVEIVLLAEEVDEFQIFVTESAKSAVVDTACSRTVAGEIWFNNYLSELNESLMDKVTITKSHVPFRFGDGRKVYSFISARIPIMIYVIHVLSIHVCHSMNTVLKPTWLHPSVSLHPIILCWCCTNKLPSSKN